jgi:hypothetical protein
MGRFAAVVAVAVLFTLLACQGRDTSESCGTPSAPSHCESTTWPRLVIAFGDPSAAAFAYSVHDDSGAVFSQRNECPGGSTTLRCDIGFYSNPVVKPVMTLRIADGDGGAVLVSRDIALTPFNYCGNGVAQVVVVAGDAGLPQVSDVQYVDACGSP